MRKDPTPPERLWKYRPWDSTVPESIEHTRRLIMDGEVFFAKREKLNDPFELRFPVRVPTDDTEKERFAREILAKHSHAKTPNQWVVDYLHVLAWVNDAVDKYENGIIPPFIDIWLGVLCLSNVNESIPMWSYYADHHRGVCVAVRP